MTSPDPIKPRRPRPEPQSASLPLAGRTYEARPSGALWDPAARRLAVADLHLGKAVRLAREGGPFLPPYEVEETLSRLAGEIERLKPAEVICLGDSFDDMGAVDLLEQRYQEQILMLMAGRRWYWIAGNHDPAPLDLGGRCQPEHVAEGVEFRHIASPLLAGDMAEASGHFHPKARLRAAGRRISRRCFMADARRVILPAFGAYTGGLDATDSAFDGLLGADAQVLLCSRDGVRALPRSALADQ